MTIRPFQAGRPSSAFSRSTQRTATRTISALAASLAGPALIEEPSSSTSPDSDAGPRLFAIVAEIPLFASSRATLEPRAPAPIMPILNSLLLLMKGCVAPERQRPDAADPVTFCEVAERY